MSRTYLQLIFVFIVLIKTNAQTKKIELEDIFLRNTFQAGQPVDYHWSKTKGSYFQFHKSGNGSSIDLLNIKSGAKIKTAIEPQHLILEGEKNPISVESFEFNKDESFALMSSQIRPVFRHSFESIVYVFDCTNKILKPLFDRNLVGNVSFSPDGLKVAFCFNNDLYVKDLTSEKMSRITDTGKRNAIINGSADWVYEEEFELIRAYQWSPDSKFLAYYTFDESEVKEYTIQNWDSLYPSNIDLKYPKAGEKNSTIKIYVADVSNAMSNQIFDGTGKDIYVPRIYWANSTTLAIHTLNRDQDTLQIWHSAIRPTTIKLKKSFSSKDYIEVNDDFHYLANGRKWLYTSEFSGYRHIYMYDQITQQEIALTKGNWEVSCIINVDTAKKRIFYYSKEPSTREQHAFVIGFNGKDKRQLINLPGYNTIEFSPGFDFFTCHNSSLEGNKSALYGSSLKKIKDLSDNVALVDSMKMYGFGKIKFHAFKNNENIEMNAWALYPQNFDSTKKHPLMMVVYGGPGSQKAINIWNGNQRIWFEYLAQKGYIVACLDNRGTGGKGTVFKNISTRQLGKYESNDQIDFAKYMGYLPYIDKNRIGIFGWSFGGYLSSLCLLLGNEVFKMAIAVAPVTSWRFYDTIYTERYLKQPKDNPEGYDAFSPLSHAEKLKGKLLLIHGTSDDNVHFQNSTVFQKKLIEAGKQFDTFIYPNKNHAIGGRNARQHLYIMMSEYILENL